MPAELTELDRQILGYQALPEYRDDLETSGQNAYVWAGQEAQTAKTRKAAKKASNIRAAIARDQWQDYKTRFQPLENILLGYAQNPNSLIQPLREEAMGRINSQYGLALPMAQRRLGSYGLTMTDDQRQRFQNRNQMDKKLAEVQAMNQIKRFGDEQLFNIVGGVSSGKPELGK